MNKQISVNERSANEEIVGLNSDPVEAILAELPLVPYRAGETILRAGSKTGQLFVLKDGAVTVFKHGVEIGRVEEPGAVFGELSALLDQPHTADVQALRDSLFHVADAAAFTTNPTLVFYVAQILARRLVAGNNSLIELKNRIQAGQPPGALREMLDNVEQILSVGGSKFEQWI